MTLRRAAWLIVAVGVFVPLHTYIANPDAISQPAAHLAVFAGFLGIILGIVALLWRLGLDRSTVAYSAVMFLLLFWSGRALRDALGGAASAVLAAIALWALGTSIVYRLRSTDFVHKVFLALGVYMTLLPWASGIGLEQTPTDPGVVASKVEYPGGDYRPDIVLVIFDGYPGIQTLASWDEWDGSIVERLTERGFRVEPGWSAYTRTGFSLSGLLDVSYPVVPVDGFASSARPEVTLVERGEAAAFGFLEEAGYTIIHLESPWWGSQCGAAVDICVGAPVLDYVLYRAVGSSFLGLWLERRLASPFVHGARRNWEWLQQNAGDLVSNGSPDFVLAHVVAPHEPLVLDSQCNVRTDKRLGEDAVFDGLDADGRRAFLDQAACVDSVMLDLAEEFPPDTILVFTADHGSPFLGQGRVPPGEWSVEQLRERHSTFFAMRARAQCQPGDPVVVQNILRGVMRCLGARDLPDLEVRLFPGGFSTPPVRLVELADDEVEKVLEAGEPPSR